MLSAAVHISATVAGGAPVCTSMSHNFDCTLWFKNTRHQNNFTDVLRRKFATKSCLNIPPRLKCVAILRCEIWMSKMESIWNTYVINDKSQGIIAKHLRNDDLLYYTFTVTLLVKEFLTLVNIGGKVTGKMVDCVIHPIRLALLSSKMQISPDKLNNLCITDSNCY